MSAVINAVNLPDRFGQELLNDVVHRFVELLIAGGAPIPMINQAVSNAVASAVENKAGTVFTELGSLQRDCMEVMCTWRRDTRQCGVVPSFSSLCARAGCLHDSAVVLKALVDFGAVSIGADGMIRSETPTFLLGREAGQLLATDGLLKQLEGFLQVVHRNVCSIAGQDRPRFERACTVSVALELEPIFDRLVRQRGQEFIDSVDEWLERNAKKESASGRYLELGAGAYYIDLCNRTSRTIKG